MLEVKSLTVRYGAVTAVRDVSLEVAEREVVTLLGANGAGKSSTLAAIMGLVRPSSGRVLLRDQDITGWRPEDIVRSGMTLTPEGRRLFPALSVEENMTLGAASGRERAGVLQRKEEMLDLFPVLRRRWNQLAGTLSGGEQQQLAMARSLMSDPDVLLLDEPSLGLAPMFVDLVFALLERLRAERGLTILLVEQNVHRALGVSDRGYVLNTGQIEMTGQSDELLASSEIERAYLGVGARP
jgi:branched-chain amino acid transport system ATP-binding protein